MSWLKELFSEQSTVSMMRLMSFMVVLTACKLALDHGDVATIATLLSTGFLGKVGQKAIEKQ